MFTNSGVRVVLLSSFLCHKAPDSFVLQLTRLSTGAGSVCSYKSLPSPPLPSPLNIFWIWNIKQCVCNWGKKWNIFPGDRGVQALLGQMAEPLMSVTVQDLVAWCRNSCQSGALIGLIKECMLLIYLRQGTLTPFNCQHIYNPSKSGIVDRVPNILGYGLPERGRSVFVISNKANVAV